MAFGFKHRLFPRRGVYSLKQISETIEPIARSYGVEKIYLFGSYARGEADSSSDVDLLVYPGRVRGMAIGGLLSDISDALDRKVDIITDCSNPRFLNIISNDLVLIYAE